MAQEELAETEYWLVGAYSATLDHSFEYILIDVDCPGGRYTKDERQAWTWAHEFAAQASQDANSGATDWVAQCWIGPRKN
jgi:hypothetical protein